MVSLIEGIVLGSIQGIAEWLPVSSEGLLVLAQLQLFGEVHAVELIRFALFLHVGTFLAALVYLRKEVVHLIQRALDYKKAPTEDKALVRFLVVATIVSGVVGYPLVLGFSGIGSPVVILLAIGVFLVVTGWLQIQRKVADGKPFSQLQLADSVIAGVAQGFSALPGLSRSGLTVSTLLLRGFGTRQSLLLSFLMSLPVVFGANIILNLEYFAVSLHSLAALLASFIFGLLTIHVLLKVADRVAIGYFVIVFGVLMIIAALI